MIPKGAIVILKSGGPAMTVIAPQRAGMLDTVWFDGATPCRNAFEEADLVVVHTPSPAIETTTPPEPIEPPEFRTGQPPADSVESEEFLAASLLGPRLPTGGRRGLFSLSRASDA
jgi:uncharacterized protein YodC (DUF2158 family)